MSDHIHDCPQPGCSNYTICGDLSCSEPQQSDCIDCLRAEIRRLTEGTLLAGDKIREDIFPVFRELLIWADNWLPDEAKDQGAREVLRRCKTILNT